MEISRIVEEITKNIRSAWGNKAQLEDIQQTMSTIQGVVGNFEAKQLQEMSGEEREYMKVLMDAVYDAEDMLLEVALIDLRKDVIPSSEHDNLLDKVKTRLDAVANSGKKFAFNNVEYVPLIDILRQHNHNHNNNVDEDEQRTTNQELPSSYPVPTNNERLIPKIIMIIWGVIFNKWIYRLLNVVFEISQVALSEVNGRQKISNLLCYKLIFMISAICLLISLGEFVIEAKQSNRVVWQRRGLCCWFYYNNGRLFAGNLPLNFSVISSVTQFCINLAILLTNKRFFKADYFALLFAIVALISPMNHHPQQDAEESDHEV